jgi:hypothetical protein
MDIDPIIGTWQLTSKTENGTEIYTKCCRKNTLTFLSNGTTSEVYYYDNGNTTCDTDTDSANWENVGNSNYKVDYGDNDSQTEKITFSENNSIFSFTSTEEFNGTTETYTGTYKKI